MGDKNLSELEWKKFAKGRDLKDAALVKGLAALERAKAPDQQLEALSEIEKQADALRKAGKNDKELAAYLGDLDKALDKQRKLSEFEAKKAKAAQADAEDDETPAALTSQMVPLLRQLRKDGEFPTLLAVAGKDVAVLVSRRSIAAGKRKLLAEHLGVSGGIKYIPGHCLFEENAYTFVVQAQAAGLAKRLKAALLAQTGLRLKVRVRGEDPADIDDDGEPAEDEAPETQGEQPPGGTTPTAGTAGTAGTVPDAPPPEDPLKAQYEARLAALEPRVLAMLKAQSGDVSKIRAVAEFVRGKGEEGNYKAGLQGMESLAKLLTDIPPAPPLPDPKAAAPRPATEQDPQAAAFNARLAALLPHVKQMTAAQSPRLADFKLRLSEAGVFARKKEFDRANELLDGADEMLRADAPPDRAAWDARLAAIEPGYLGRLGQNPPDATRLRAVMAFAQEAAEAGQFAKALGALDQLAKLIAAAAPSANEAETETAPDAATQAAPAAGGNPETGYKGLVAYRKTLLDLRAAVAKVEGQIASLLAAIPEQAPDDADLAQDLARELRAANEDLQDLVDDAMGSAGSDTPVSRALARRLDALIDEVESNEVIKHVDANPFGVPLSIGATLAKALGAVRAAVPQPA